MWLWPSIKCTSARVDRVTTHFPTSLQFSSVFFLHHHHCSRARFHFRPTDRAPMMKITKISQLRARTLGNRAACLLALHFDLQRRLCAASTHNSSVGATCRIVTERNANANRADDRGAFATTHYSTGDFIKSCLLTFNG